MGSDMSGLGTTVRFLQEENQRLDALRQELEEENAYLHECQKSIRGLQKAVMELDLQTELMTLLNRIVYEAVRMVDAAEGSLSLIDEETQELVFVVVKGEVRSQLVGYRMPQDEGIAGWVATHRVPVIANDVTQDERFSATVDIMLQFRTESLLCVPLISRNKVLGVIEVVNKFSGRPFDERDKEMLETLAPIAATGIDLAGYQCAA
jgi:sigma-B regulation protein RsbU (phosphoserine phosphatase)